MLVVLAILARAASALQVAAIRAALRHLPMSPSARIKLWMRLRVEISRWK